MSILVIYGDVPSFPATDQQPGAARVQIGNLWVDYTGAIPTQADVDAFYAPEIADAAKVTAIKANARRRALVTAIQNSDDVQLLTYVNNNVTDLPSARTMLANLALLVAGVIRS